MEQNKIIANPARRLLAYLVDMGIGMMLTLIILQFIISAASLPGLLNNILNYFVISLIAANTLIFLYIYLFITKLGGTLGCLSAGIRITDKEGKYLGFKMSCFRMIIAPSVSAALLWLGYIWILIDKEHRAWHDLVSGTWLIVKNRSGNILGIVILVLIIAGNVILAKNVVSTVKDRIPFYKEVVTSIVEEVSSTFAKSSGSNSLPGFDALITPMNNIKLSPMPTAPTNNGRALPSPTVRILR